mmetsp:Transcript_39689/g.99744  ORF Transcript_39689/g.99744 Transcript_39689/m.99744 type:complete len:94 (+) Transcript_39689:127-408(+)
MRHCTAKRCNRSATAKSCMDVPTCLDGRSIHPGTKVCKQLRPERPWQILFFVDWLHELDSCSALSPSAPARSESKETAVDAAVRVEAVEKALC